MRGAFKSTHVVPVLVLAAGLLLPAAQWEMAQAAGMGKISVLSRYGQPFLAEIDLINVTRDELPTLNASLAPTSAYLTANLRLDPVLNSLRLSLERRADGTPFVRATTTSRVYEPYMDLLVDLTWQGGKFQRHYSALVDLPSGSDAAAASAVAASPTSPLLPSLPQVPASSSARSAPAAKETSPAPAAPTDRLPPLRAVPARKPVMQDVPQPVPAAPPATTAAKGAQTAGTPTSPQTAGKPGETAIAPTKGDSAKPADAAANANAPVTASTGTTATSPAQSEPPQGEARAEAKPEPKAEPKAAEPASTPVSPVTVKPAPAVTPAPVERGLMATLMDYWLLVAGVLLALAVMGFLFLRQRDNQRDNESHQAEAPAEPDVDAASEERHEPFHSPGDNTVRMDTTAIPAAAAVAAPAQVTVANSSDVVDPLDEAKVYVAYGQYEEAEKVLRAALSKQRGREDVQVTLLEILAEQGDKEGFHKIAGDMHKRTGGRGENWKRVAAMGYSLDPAHPLYPPTAEAAEAAEAARRAAETPASAATDAGDSGLDEEKTLQLARVGLDTVAPATAPPVAEFVIDFPQERPREEVSTGDNAAAPVAAREDAGLEFNMDFPAIDVEAKTEAQSDAAFEYKVEVPDALPQSASKEEIPAAEAAVHLPVIEVPGEPGFDAGDNSQPKDEHWHDVQQKFDLVRAYQEMGDEDGVREVLGEIESEGDAGQQAEARKLRSALK